MGDQVKTRNTQIAGSLAGGGTDAQPSTAPETAPATQQPDDRDAVIRWLQGQLRERDELIGHMQRVLAANVDAIKGLHEFNSQAVKVGE